MAAFEARVTSTYSPGVLIGNWFEDLRVREDKLKLFRSLQAQEGKNASGASAALFREAALANHACQASALGTSSNGCFVPLGTGLQIRSVSTGAVVTVDPSPRLAPKPHHLKVCASANAEPMVSNTWYLRRAPDENNVAYNTLTEDGELHYGQRVHVVSAYVEGTGMYYLASSLNTVGTSGPPMAMAGLSDGSDSIFIVYHPASPRSLLRGERVLSGDPIALMHANTNTPLRVSPHRRTTATGDSASYEVSCAYTRPSLTPGRAAAAIDQENLFVLVSADSAAAKNVPSSRRLLNGREPPTSTASRAAQEALESLRKQVLQLSGLRGVRAFARALGVHLDHGYKRHMTREHLSAAMTLFGLPVTPLVLDAAFHTLDTNGSGTIAARRLVNTLREPPMSNRRTDALVQAFQQILVEGCGSVDIKDLTNLLKWNAASHPHVLAGAVPREQVIRDFLSDWDGLSGTVTLEQFVEYHADISPAVAGGGDIDPDGDTTFEQLVAALWRIPDDTTYLNGGSSRCATVTFTDKSHRNIMLPDSLVVSNPASLRDLLTQRGLRNVAEVQLCDTTKR